MKIAFVNDGIYPYASRSPKAVGGAEREQWLLARALAAAGWSSVVGVRKELKLGERKFIDGVEYVGIGDRQILLAWFNFLSAERPDWLHWKCAYHLWGVLVELAKVTGVRTIFHAAYDTDFVPRKALYLRRRWWPLYAWGLSRADRIFVQHEGQLSGLNARWRSKACILPKVCTLPQSVGDVPAAKPHAVRANYVAWVAMLRKHKRPDILVEIARRAPHICFVVCGGTTTSSTPAGFGEGVVDNLRTLPNVDYRGRVSPDEAMKVIADAAVFLSTSEEEGFPNTFTQAWSAGTPVISLRLDPGGLIDRIGMGTVANSIDHAVASIHALMQSSERRDEIAYRARAFIEENHSATRVVKLFEEALVTR